MGEDHFGGLREVTDVFLDQSPIHLESLDDVTPKKEFPQMTEARRPKTHQASNDMTPQQQIAANLDTMFDNSYKAYEAHQKPNIA